jgi:hypothetical protein
MKKTSLHDIGTLHGINLSAYRVLIYNYCSSRNTREFNVLSYNIVHFNNDALFRYISEAGIRQFSVLFVQNQKII